MKRSGMRLMQTDRDAKNNKERLEKDGQANIDSMRRILGDLFGSFFHNNQVKYIARLTANEMGMKVDRRANRIFEVLIAWIYENWETIEEKFIDITKLNFKAGIINKKPFKTPKIKRTASLPNKGVFLPSKEASVPNKEVSASSEEVSVPNKDDSAPNKDDSDHSEDFFGTSEDDNAWVF